MKKRILLGAPIFGGIGLLIVAAVVVAVVPHVPAWISAMLQVAGSLIGILIGWLLDRFRNSDELALKAKAAVRHIFGQVDRVNGVRAELDAISTSLTVLVDSAGPRQMLALVDRELQLTADSFLADVANWDDLAPGTFKDELAAVKERRFEMTRHPNESDTGEADG